MLLFGTVPKHEQKLTIQVVLLKIHIAGHCSCYIRQWKHRHKYLCISCTWKVPILMFKMMVCLTVAGSLI